MQGVQTRINPTEAQIDLLHELLEDWNRAVRQTYARWAKGRLAPDTTRTWLKSEHQLTSHQADAVVARVEQWRAMDQETTQFLLTQAEEKWQHSQAKVDQITTDLDHVKKAGRFCKPEKLADLRSQLFHARRQLVNAQNRKNHLQDTVAHHTYSRVFGSRKLLGQRTRLDSVDSPWANTESWRQEWDRRRDGEITMSGNSHQTLGNESLQWNPEENSLTIRLTHAQAQRRFDEEARRLGVPVEKVPNRLSFKRLVLTGVELSPKFKEQLRQAQALKLPICISLQRKPLPATRRQQDGLKTQLRGFSRGPGRHGKKRVYKTHQAREQAKKAQLRDRQAKADVLKQAAPEPQFGWYIHASFDLPAAEKTTSRHRGVLGVDVNAWGLAWCVATPDGNVAKNKAGRSLKGNLPLDLKGLTSRQAKAQVQQAVQTLVGWAHTHQVALAHEDLDFTQKKLTMKGQGRGYARMLSGLRTAGFEQALRARARKQGIPVHGVNPAWTSVSGFAKYGLRNGLSIDQAAGFAVARKCLLGKEPAGFAQPLPTHAKGSGKKLNPKFRRALQAQRDSYTFNYDEPVRFAQPVPRVFQRKSPGQTSVTWRDVQHAMGSDRRTWVHTLTRPSRQAAEEAPAVRPPGRHPSTRIVSPISGGRPAVPSRSRLDRGSRRGRQHVN